MKLKRPLGQDVEGRLKLEAVPEQADARENVQTWKNKNGNEQAVVVAQVVEPLYFVWAGQVWAPGWT